MFYFIQHCANRTSGSLLKISDVEHDLFRSLPTDAGDIFRTIHFCHAVSPAKLLKTQDGEESLLTSLPPIIQTYFGLLIIPNP